MKWYGSLIVFGLLVCLGSISSGDKADEKGATTDAIPTVPDFAGLDDKAASKAADDLVKSYLDIERNLICQLNAEGMPKKRKVFLIYALGRMRSREAVDDLIKTIDYESIRLEPAIDAQKWSRYPVTDALASIGDPAVRGILKALPTETNDLRILLSVSVIHEVAGDKLGQACIENALAGAKEESAKNNLRNALKAYNALISK